MGFYARPEDTICAIATPIGEGGIGIVRISGALALSVAGTIVRLRSGRTLDSVSSHTLHLADIIFPDRGALGHEPVTHVEPPGYEIIDEGLVVYMNGARSFTAEDVVELHCHGSGVVLGRVCEACIVAGARLAEPGEFTKRAFMNGRLDLSQAEAVLDTIRAKSEAGLKVAQRHLRGDLRQHVDELRLRLLSILAHVEAGIDFVEEDIVFVGQDQLTHSLDRALTGIQKLLRTAKVGRVLREGARVVIVGSPNVGKSSLLNSLLKEQRAIVTNIPGTTRDVLEEAVVWSGLTITLVDTAGLRESDDVVEQEGMRRARAAEADADVVLHVLDAEKLHGHSALRPLRQDGRLVMALLNKVDLIDERLVPNAVQTIYKQLSCDVFPISARTGYGLEQVKAKVVSHLSQGCPEVSDGLIVTNVRHQSALDRAAASLTEALRSTERNVAPEFIAVDLRDAADALGEITGAITSDEVLTEIFAQFCIGK